MQVKSNLNLKQSNCQNDVRFECLSRKRSSNWRPPVEEIVNVSTNKNFGKYVTNQENKNNENYKLRNTTTDKRKQKSYHDLKNRLVKNFTTISNDDIKSNSNKKTHENSHYWPRSRHKDKNERMTIINKFSDDNNFSDPNHQPQTRTTPPLQMSKIDLHSSSTAEVTSSSSVAASDIYSRCLQEKEQHVNDDFDDESGEGDFVNRKERNLFFRRNQTHLMKQWKYCNFFNWLMMNGCYKKTLLDAGGGMMMRCKKTISYFGSGRSSTIMLFLLIFSILISGPGEAYPVEGGMYNVTISFFQMSLQYVYYRNMKIMHLKMLLYSSKN